MIDFSLSVLPHLEPFAGIAFALNLAYIGLPRFRYRARIQEHVADKLKEIDGSPHNFVDTEWYKGPQRLARMKDDASDISKTELPRESWALGYSRIFERHGDKATAVFFASVLGMLLALGSAHSAEHYGSLFGYSFMGVFSGAMFHFWFVSITIMALTPVYFVWRGNGVVHGACDYADKQFKNMKKSMQSKV